MSEHEPRKTLLFRKRAAGLPWSFGFLAVAIFAYAVQGLLNDDIALLFSFRHRRTFSNISQYTAYHFHGTMMWILFANFIIMSSSCIMVIVGYYAEGAKEKLYNTWASWGLMTSFMVVIIVSFTRYIAGT